MSARLVGLAIVLALPLAACEREHRRFRESPPGAGSTAAITMSDLQAGPQLLATSTEGPYDGNAYAVSEGKRLYSQFNCSGCHAMGGGGSGPPLMDDEWIYGSEPGNVFQTIVEGRPNGMPSFRGRIPNQQLWQLVAYVRSMSGLLPKDVKSGRDDHMQVKIQEQEKKADRPKVSGIPKASEVP